MICGIFRREFLSPETISFFDETIIRPSEEILLNALNLLIAPVIFFSIIGISSEAGVGKIGLKLISFSFFSVLVSLIFSCVGAWICFSGDLPPIHTLPAAQSAAEGYEFSLIQFIVNIIPADFVSPILNGKILQIIFIATFVGISLNALGDKVSLLKEFAVNLNALFTKMISTVIFFVPPIAFFAMISLVVKLNAGTLTLISRLLVGQIILSAIMFVFCMIFISRVGKISSVPFAKKVSTIFPMAFAISSSTVVMPSMMVDALSDRIATCINVMANMAVATILARTENLFDEKIYLK